MASSVTTTPSESACASARSSRSRRNACGVNARHRRRAARSRDAFASEAARLRVSRTGAARIAPSGAGRSRLDQRLDVVVPAGWGARRRAPAAAHRQRRRSEARAMPPAPNLRARRRRCRSTRACRAAFGPAGPARIVRCQAPPPRPRPAGATTARRAHVRSGSCLRRAGIAWAVSPPKRRPLPAAGTSAQLTAASGAGAARLFDHAIERLARLDHAQLAARALLDRGLAGLEVSTSAASAALRFLQLRVLLLLRPRRWRRRLLTSGDRPAPSQSVYCSRISNAATGAARQQSAHVVAVLLRSALQADEGGAAGVARLAPSASSMRSSWLYLATRSLRHSEPVLIWVAWWPPRYRRWWCLRFRPSGATRPRRSRRIGHRDRFQRFGQRADLVDLDQDRVGDALVDAFA
jgi:hypothetical protein